MVDRFCPAPKKETGTACTAPLASFIHAKASFFITVRDAMQVKWQAASMVVVAAAAAVTELELHR